VINHIDSHCASQLACEIELQLRKILLVLNIFTKPLGFIGRYGTQGFALSLFVGLALPQFAAAARPLLGVSIFIFTTLTFARAEREEVVALFKAPRPLILSSIWILLAPVVLIGLLLSVIGRSALDPGLVMGLAIMAAAPPIMSSPAVAMMLGLKPTLLLTTVLLTTAIAPVVSPLLVELVAGASVPLDISILIQRLAFLIGGAIMAAFALRKWLGMAQIRANKTTFDGIGVIMYFIFAIAAMDGVMEAAISDPWRVTQFTGFAFLMAILGFVAAWIVLQPLEKTDRFVLGYATCQRNMGLLIAALGAAAPKTTFLFFALAQFPIYLMPQMVKRFAKRFRVDKAG
jgi:bile acid:Na+ symporter, BASS family